MLPGSNCFEACLKNWQMPCIVPCSAEFKAIDEESINIPENAFKIDKYTSVETGNVKLSNSFLPFIYLPSNTLLDICISIIDKETYLENKDLLEEIDFPSEDVNIK
ncbi:hypothetical protein C2G38_2188899 [Gigaspora rosea]|uniref:Uncharacterized protein n=1 Tax=Gigaspora rosea TaxID=44941 RepID=A0A397V7B9_9GLOM|nr:hypothetical protein C2G38_2188899 [Gigaspora rosea]